MKRVKLSALLLALILVLCAFFGCGGEKTDVSPEDNNGGTKVEEKKEENGEEQKPEPEPVVVEDTVVSVVACGDNIVHGPIYEQGKKEGYEGIYEYIADVVKEKDLAYINVETLIGGDEYGFSGYPNFNAPEAMGKCLVNLGFDVMNLAHNHMLDAPGADKAKYLRNCSAWFEEKGVTPIGYYKSEEDTENIRITEVKGIKIAWLAYTYDDSSVSYRTSAGSYAMSKLADVIRFDTAAYTSFSLNGHKPNTSKDVYIPFMKKALIEKQVAIAKEKADVVIVSVHWGPEDSYSAPNGVFSTYPMQEYYGQVFADCGVDIVIGMHPHVIQKTSWIEGKNGNKTLCAYSLGNLISRMLWGRNMLGAMLEFNIVKDGATGKISIEEAYMVPTVCHYNSSSKDFKIYPLNMYTEELAKKHGCHAKDSVDATRGKKFSVAALVEHVTNCYDSEFLKEDMGF